MDDHHAEEGQAHGGHHRVQEAQQPKEPEHVFLQDGTGMMSWRGSPTGAKRTMT
jgi:hypothetical protein